MKKLYKVDKLVVFMVAADSEDEAKTYVSDNLEYLIVDCCIVQPLTEAYEVCEDITLSLAWRGIIPYSTEVYDTDMRPCEEYF